MRIISGQLGGRQFNAPHGHKTHPMSDKLRGALFNVLGDVAGLLVLDAFAGSGALAFEALSRGAKHATLIESDRNAQRTIAENIQNLQLEQKASLIKASVSAWSSTSAGKEFNIVLADPPYNDLQATSVQKLIQHVIRGGLLILSWPGDQTIPELADCQRLANHRYGDAQLVFYRRLP